jgi:hypothetical protein
MNPTTRPGSDVAVLPLVLWLAVQLLALAIPTLHIPLHAREPMPSEVHALQIVAMTQVWLAAMLYPLILNSWQNTILACGSSAVFLLLAGLLAASPSIPTLLTTAYVILWLITLAVLSLSPSIPGDGRGEGQAVTVHTHIPRNIQALLLCFASTLCALGPVLHYIAREFQGRSLPLDWSPTMAIAKLASDSAPLPFVWLLTFLVAALLVRRMVQKSLPLSPTGYPDSQ